jgi:MFS transporter, FSR family, fosmidomycin resistance protein
MIKNRLVWLAAVGHLCTDINQGAVPTLLPFFIAEYHLSYAAAAGFVSALSIASTVVQPLFGYYSDRLSKPWLIPIGVLLAGYGVAFSTVFPDYWFAVFAFIISGIGIAAFHPEGARLVHHAAGEKKATGMSIFGVGGQAGIAIGPLFVTLLVTLWGLKGTLFFLVPYTIMAIVLASQLFSSSSDPISSRGMQRISTTPTQKDAWIPFIFLTATVILRSIIFYGLNTFIPLYWINTLHQSKSAGGTALSIMFAAGIVGTLWGGRMADHYGHRRVILAGFGALIPLLLIFVWVPDVKMATALLIPIGIVLLSTYSPLVVMGQRYLPNHVGLASGITLGVAVSIGGIMAPLLGHIADGYGLPAAFQFISFLPIGGILLTLTIPSLTPGSKNK